jgi:hypothetical protein
MVDLSTGKPPPPPSNKIFTQDNGHVDLPKAFSKHRMDELQRFVVDSIIISQK